ncbi:hypothetical protein PDIDSM_7157 [Penicillium digitatum]|nr:hypothetical protein PDIDSM_7157 [Penicillium digitatum]
MQYTKSAAADQRAQEEGYNLYSMYDEVHRNHNYEDFEFPVSGTYYEFPILRDGEVYDGGSPGADRVIFNDNDELAGVITHDGASGDDFVACN